MALSNTAILCFVMGYQGGTVHQVAKEVGVTTNDILDADEEQMGTLCRKAQAVYWAREKADLNTLLFKHLGRCLQELSKDYAGHEAPAWLDRANGVYKIMAETYDIRQEAMTAIKQ